MSSGANDQRWGRMGKFGTLTVGIISRNGQPFIEDCLQSFSSALPALSEHFDAVEFIGVDSNSSDNTLGVMLTFSQGTSLKSITSNVYLIEGYCNAAIARNVILKNASGDFIFLCDGDIVVNFEFVIAAARKINIGQADAVVGQLAEKWYDADCNFYKSIPVRIKITQEHNVRISGGINIISREIADSGIKFDERLERNEDWDYSLRVSERFNIHAIPEFMGTHLTQPYYSEERFSTFIKEKYGIFPGFLLRKHMLSPGNVTAIAKAERGPMVGIFNILFILLSAILCLFDIYIPFFIALIIMLLDFIRHFSKHPVKRYIMNRFISPFMVIWGFFFHDGSIGNYTVKKISNPDDQTR